MKWIFLIFFALPASAQVTYVYTGAPLVLVTNSEEAPLLPNVIGQIVLSAPLAPNQTGQVVTPIAFYFLGPSTDLSTSFTGTINGSSDAQGQFSFDTQGGIITAWHIIVTGGAPKNTDTVQVDSSTGDLYENDFFGCGPTPCTYQSSTPTPGTWTYGADLVAQLQKQVVHVSAQMSTYKAATAQYEAEYLGFYQLDLQQQATMAKCRANKGVC